jgi:hypothetical protein
LTRPALQLADFEGGKEFVGGDDEAEAQAVHTVQEARPDHIHPEESPEPFGWQVGVEVVAEPATAFDGVAKEAGLYGGVLFERVLVKEGLGLQGGVTVMLGDIVFEAPTVLMEQEMAEVAGLAVEDHVFMHGAILVVRPAVLEKTQVPTGVIATVANAFPHEDQRPVYEEARFGNVCRRLLAEKRDFVPKSLGDSFVGIDDQRPGSVQRKIPQSPVLLSRIAFPCVLDHFGAESPGNFTGPIRGA